LEAFVGFLTGLAVLALVGNFFEPLPRLRVHVGQVGEGSQRPEVLADVTDGALYFPFGEKRALQTVVMMAQKFLPSHILSIP
jgi:hypothetical protein